MRSIEQKTMTGHLEMDHKRFQKHLSMLKYLHFLPAKVQSRGFKCKHTWWYKYQNLSCSCSKCTKMFLRASKFKIYLGRPLQTTLMGRELPLSYSPTLTPHSRMCTFQKYPTTTMYSLTPTTIFSPSTLKLMENTAHLI